MCSLKTWMLSIFGASVLISPALYGQEFQLALYPSTTIVPGHLFFDGHYYGDDNLDESLLRVYYDVLVEVDTTIHEQYRMTEVLSVGKRWTKFQEISRDEYEQAVRKDYASAYRSYWKKICPIAHYLFYADTYYIDNYSRQCFFTFKFGADDYKITEPAPVIMWEIQDSVKIVAGRECSLAKGHFGGREWEVWFSQEIPYSSGPWKLSGLPGLILEARERNSQYCFECIGISSEKVPITMAKYPYSKMTRRKYNREARLACEDYVPYINAHISRVSSLLSIEWKAPMIEKYNRPMGFDLIEREK